jgi:hypothetical protein
MGFNFRKSLKIAPGVKLNITKKGISSLSVGKNGARVNIGKKGVKTTAGIPKTGLSYSKFSNYENKNRVVTKTDKKMVQLALDHYYS